MENEAKVWGEVCWPRPTITLSRLRLKKKKKLPTGLPCLCFFFLQLYGLLESMCACACVCVLRLSGWIKGFFFDSCEEILWWMDVTVRSVGSSGSGFWETDSQVIWGLATGNNVELWKISKLFKWTRRRYQRESLGWYLSPSGVLCLSMRALFWLWGLFKL